MSMQNNATEYRPHLLDRAAPYVNFVQPLFALVLTLWFFDFASRKEVESLEKTLDDQQKTVVNLQLQIATLQGEINVLKQLRIDATNAPTTTKSAPPERSTDKTNVKPRGVWKWWLFITVAVLIAISVASATQTGAQYRKLVARKIGEIWNRIALMRRPNK